MSKETHVTIRMLRRLILLLALASILGACGGATASPAGENAPAAKAARTYKQLVVGFAQIGAESGWRTANTLSIQETAQDLGLELKFADGQQKQENQIAAIRGFIAQKVDVIGVSPIVETGWDTVFSEVKAAGIPLILLDRHAKVPGDLFAAFIGSDFALEGENACKEMARLLNNKGAIVELEGTVGSAPAIDRKTGFHNCLKNYPDMQVLASQSGDFTHAQGRTVMQAFLKSYGKGITALYAHNDDMALGAIEAIEAAGLKPGVDIKIVSVDGVRGAFEAMVAGKLNVTVECNPLLGPQFFETALKLANGEPIDKWVKSKEGIYRQDTAQRDLAKRAY
jgi:galactofuranose transport system substrate-binding protein